MHTVIESRNGMGMPGGRMPPSTPKAFGAAAKSRWVQLPIGDCLVVSGKVFVLGEEIGVSLAARIVGRSKRRLQAMCEEGILLVEGKDWRKVPSRTGNGHYLIRKEAVLRLRGIETETLKY